MKPVLGVMKIGEYEDAVFYRVMCDCRDYEHDVRIEIEHDDFNYLTLRFYVTIVWNWWADKGLWGWVENKWRRFKAAIRLLFTGWIDLEADFLLKDP